MRYTAGKRRKAIEYEKYWARRWKDDRTFEKSIENRSNDDAYVFYDGPPFITGVPHHGTLLSSVVKDAVPRYWTMQGKRVERVWGWDCHGLPAEVFTEKKLGIQDKRDIGTKISLEEYITTCRDNMVQTGNLWEDTIDRIGRWVDFRGAYKTMDKDFMESVWWAFKKLYEGGKIYEGEKVLMYCTRDATPISKAEVAMDNSYQQDTDPSIYAFFKLLPENVTPSDEGAVMPSRVEESRGDDGGDLSTPLRSAQDDKGEGFAQDDGNRGSSEGGIMPSGVEESRGSHVLADGISPRASLGRDDNEGKGLVEMTGRGRRMSTCWRGRQHHGHFRRTLQ